MVPVMCIVQEGQISQETEIGLKAQIGDFTQRAFSAPADIDWIVVPVGFGFSGAAPSRSLIVSLSANRAVSQTEHDALLRELSDICAMQKGCSRRDVTVTLRRTKE